VSPFLLAAEVAEVQLDAEVVLAEQRHDALELVA
jgi:hypothetical protein